MKKILLLSIASALLFSCTKKEDPAPAAKTLKDKLAGTSWKPQENWLWTLKFTKDSAFYMTTYIYPFTYCTSNDTLFFLSGSDTTKYKVSISDRTLIVINIPFTGACSMYEQVGGN